MELSATTESELQRLFGLTYGQIDKVLGVALKGRQRDGAYCDIYLQCGSTQGVSWDQGHVASTSNEVIRGAGVRVVIGDKVGYSYTDHVNVTNLRKAAIVARGIAEHARCAVSMPADGDSEGRVHNLYPVQSADVDLKQKIALLRSVDEECRSFDPRIQNVSVNIVMQDHTVIIATSFGDVILDHRPLLRLNVNCLAQDGQRRETAGSGGGGRTGFDFLLEDERWRTHARQSAADAIAALSATPAPAGEMTVVLGSGWPGVLIHEAVGHGLEGDFNRKGTSAFATLMSEAVASPLCTVIDDGTIPGRRGSLNVDDEGVPTQHNVLIERGVLTGYMQDRLNANLMGVGPTGNGRRQDYRFAPMPRMTNTYLAAGESSPDEIIASVKKGLYAVTFGGGQVDITNGNFTFSATAAFLIEDGKLTRPVKGATLIGNGPKALHRVCMVGNDLALDQGIGICGKNGQGVPVGVGMPTVRIDGVTVGGTNG